MPQCAAKPPPARQPRVPPPFLAAMNEQSTPSDKEQAILLHIARQAIEAAAHGRSMPSLDLESLPERLRAPGATFVTLTKRGMLRGCIGTLEASLPLAEDVRQHAIAAATHDFRFTPLQPGELDEVEIEISLLMDPQPLQYSDPHDLLQALRPAVDGVIISMGLQRATFLPQVWEKIPDPADFLSMLCQKAGLPSDAWRSGGLRVQTYQVVSFLETKAQSR
jgi:AmmeMemoRadiSam system protein A